MQQLPGYHSLVQLVENHDEEHLSKVALGNLFLDKLQKGIYTLLHMLKGLQKIAFLTSN